MIVVTGCPRSGTSLMMDCLRRALGDDRILGHKWPMQMRYEAALERHPEEVDEHYAIRRWIVARTSSNYQERLGLSKQMNPNGFWECRYTVPGIRWHLGIDCPPDKVCKVVSQGLAQSDPKYVDRIVFMLRHPREVAKSQEKLGRAFGDELREKEWVVHTPEMFVSVGIAVSRWMLANPDIPMILIEHAELLAEPEEELSRLKDFLGEGDFSDYPVNRRLHRSLPEVDANELWPLAEKMHDVMRESNWQGVLDVAKEHRKHLAAMNGLYCTRMMRPVATAECRNCRSHETVRQNFRDFAQQRGVDWKAEPCLFECDPLFVDDPKSIEESVSNNTWE